MYMYINKEINNFKNHKELNSCRRFNSYSGLKNITATMT